MGYLVNKYSQFVVDKIDPSARAHIKRGVFYASILVWTILAVFPLYWMTLSSIRPSEELFTTNPQIIPKLSNLTLDNWMVLIEVEVSQLFYNTLIVGTGVIGISMFVSAVGGYGLTRYEFPFKITFARIILFGYMLSPIVLAIPLFIMFRSLGLLNSYLGIILAQSTLSIPFSVWLMWNIFQSIPIEEEEAAWVMGANRFRTFKDIAIPEALPGLLAVAIFAFAVTWNDFTYSRILLSEQEAMTLPPGLVILADQGLYLHEGHLMAIGVVMSIIPIIVAYWFQHYILRGFQV